MTKFLNFTPLKYSIYYFISIIILTFSQTSHSERVGLSDEKWKTLRTEHFDVIFSAQQQNLGYYYAEVAEAAYKNLATVFTNPVERLVLVVNDTTDISNAYATVIPYPLIMAYPVQVGAHDSLSEAGEWARELVTHEMTHILQLEPANGVYTFFRPIFGSIVAPNLLMPLWWKEGMSVEMETRFSPRGRLRSVFQDTSYRAFVLAHKLFTYTLDDANEMLPSFPYGSRPYLLGSSLWSEISKDGDAKTADYIVKRQSERAPYFISEPMEEAIKFDYVEEYDRMLNSINENAEVQLKILNTVTPNSLTYIEHKGHNSSLPTISKKFQLLAFVDRMDVDPKIVVRDLKEPNKSLKFKALPSGEISGIVFHPNEKKILYSKINDLNSKYITSEIYEYDFDKEKSCQLTKGLRAREASYSADGDRIVYISTFDGKTQINIINRAQNISETIASSNYDQRLSSPIFWDSNTVLAALRDDQGQQFLIKIDLKTLTKEKINLPYPNISFLKKIADKLYFNSTENGVRNIYVTADLKTAKPVTHLLTGAWSYAVDEDQNSLWLSVLTDSGFQLANTPFFKSEAALPKIKNALAERYAKYDAKSIAAMTNQENQKLINEDYSASHYLWPRYWIPFVSSTNTNQGAYFSAQTSGSDPLSIHQYTLMGYYRTDLNRGGFSGVYSNSAFALPFELGSIMNSLPYGSLDNIIETQQSYLAFKPDLFGVDKHLGLSLGAQYLATDYNGNKTRHWGPFIQFSYFNYEQSIFQISPETGWGGIARYEDNKGLEETDKDFQRAIVGLIGYTNLFNLLPKQHAIMGKISGIGNFEAVSSRFGSSNSVAFDVPNSPTPQFVMRGYIPAQFYGRTIWNANLEYRFPVWAMEKGPAAKPIYFNNLTGAIVADGLSTDGYGVKKDLVSTQRIYSNDFFYSAGIEAKLNMTVGFILPLNLVLGYYVPFQQDYADPGLGLRFEIGGLF